MHGDDRRRWQDRRAPARELVRADARDALGREGRRRLGEAAAESGQRRLDCRAIDGRRPGRGRPIRRQHAAGGVERVGRDAEADGRLVRLLAGPEKPGEPRGASQKQHQHTGRHRIERAGVPDAPDGGGAPDARHDVV